MKKMILAAAATLFVVLGVAPTFASAGNDSSSFSAQSANIQAGGGPAGVGDYYYGRK